MLHVVTYKSVQANGLKMTNISTKSFKNKDLIHNNEVQKQSKQSLSDHLFMLITTLI